MTKELKFNCSKSLKEKAEEKLNLTLSFRQARFSEGSKFFHLDIHESDPEFNPKGLKIEKNITIYGKIISDFEEELKYNPLEIICPCDFFAQGRGECYCKIENPLIKSGSTIIIDDKILSGIPRYGLLKSSNSIVNTYSPEPIVPDPGSSIGYFKATYIEGNFCSNNSGFTIYGIQYSPTYGEEFILYITYPPAKAKCEKKNE